MALKREIKDAYIENGNSVYIKTHSNAVYVDENETETLTQRLDNIKDSITKYSEQLEQKANIKKVVWVNALDLGFKINDPTFNCTTKYFEILSELHDKTKNGFNRGYCKRISLIHKTKELSYRIISSF